MNMKKKYVAPSFGCVCMKTSAVLLNTSNTITGGAEEIMNKLECNPPYMDLLGKYTTPIQ